MVAIATEEQVNKALELRSKEVRALSISSALGHRLVLLENEEMQAKRPTLDDIFDKWDAAFRALA